LNALVCPDPVCGFVGHEVLRGAVDDTLLETVRSATAFSKAGVNVVLVLVRYGQCTHKSAYDFEAALCYDTVPDAS
jgi:hypothetical protein